MDNVTHLIQLNGLEMVRLLSAFQAMQMTAAHKMKKCYGVSNRGACKIVEELTGIKPKGKTRGRILPEKYGDESDEPLVQYLKWLTTTGIPVVQN